ncbi:MAG: TlpA family protein disulfide reductase [Rhodoferax sp.]|nr:TlpA family protein disulfide reductase [Rhodoferax sp.]
MNPRERAGDGAQAENPRELAAGRDPVAAPSASDRRRWLWVTAGVLAAGAGVSVAWRPWSVPAMPDPVVADIWALQLRDPQGLPMDLASFRGRPLVVNFWATWCPPCVEELPLLDRFFQENSSKSWQVVGIAVDQPDAVRRFLGAAPVRFPVAMAGLDGLALSRRLGNAVGGLPFTVVVTAGGQVLQRKMGRLTTADVSGWAASRD